MVITRKDLDATIFILGVIMEHVEGDDMHDATLLRKRLEQMSARREGPMKKFEINRVAQLLRLAEHKGDSILSSAAARLADTFEAQLI